MKIYKFIFCLSIFVICSGCNSWLITPNPERSQNNKVAPDSIYPASDIVIPTHSEWTKGHYRERIMQFKNEPLKKGDIVLIGNSITEGGGAWDQRLNLPKVRNRGISGDVTDGILERLGEICYYKPSSVFILIGINDLFNPSLTPEYVGQNVLEIARIIHEKSSHTKIYIQTLLPTSTQSMIPKIREVNDILKKNTTLKTYKLIDLHLLFANEKDLIKAEYTTDGLHLSENGYNRWCDCIKMYMK